MGFLSPFSHWIQLQSPTVYLETSNKQNTRTQSKEVKPVKLKERVVIALDAYETTFHWRWGAGHEI